MVSPFANVRPPEREELRRAAERNYLSLREDELSYMETLIEELLPKFEAIDRLAEPQQQFEASTRSSGTRPTDEEDPYNAVVRNCEVTGSEDGPLSGLTIGLKDNVALSGVPMTCGSTLLDSYVPTHDATVVVRLLEAGGTITAKLNMTSLFAGAQGELTATGPVRNPHDPAHLAGGSSSGSAVAVTAEMVDIALGTDQGGSIRIPAAWTGCVGLKPTYGLVPYTGITSGFEAVDHVGPLARTVTACAKALDAMAGADPLDPRQRDVSVRDYTAAVRRDDVDVTIGVLTEGFDVEFADSRVTDRVREAIEALEDDGVAVESVSIPWHERGTVLNVGHIEETAAMIKSEGIGFGSRGFADTGYAQTFGAARRTRAEDFPPYMKFTLAFGQYLADRYHSRYRAKVRNLRRRMAAAYDEALSDVDLLALPTTVRTAPAVDETITPEESIRRTGRAVVNTTPFNQTGHPAITVPCGRVDGLPVGLMLVGKRFDDDIVLNVAERAHTLCG